MAGSPDERVESVSGGDPGPSPRAFCSGTGLVFQIVGVVYFFGGCCLWSLAGQLIDRPGPAGSWWTAESPTSAPVSPSTDAGVTRWVQGAGAAAVIGTFVGGLALVAFGIGLQGEKPRSATWGAVTAGALTILWLVVAGLWTFRAGAWGRGLVGVTLAGVNGFLLLLAAYSGRVLELHPPPPEPPLPPDYA